jgi:hypothetical protein
MKRASQMLAAYLEGEVTPSESAAIEAELADSARARRRLEELRRIRAALAAPAADVEAADVVEPVMHAIERGAGDTAAGRRTPAGRGWPAWRVGAVAAAACLAGAAGFAIVARPRAPAGGDAEFRARGGAARAAAGERWAGVQAYHVASAGEPERLGARLPAGDGLLFAYTNLGPRPFAYLMIFAVDAGGAVRWCHPAYERAGQNPTSIPLRAGEARVQLAEVIRHELAPGPLEIRALFTMRPLSVLEVETWLAGRPAAGAPLPWPDASLQVIDTVVEGGRAP